MIPGLPCGGGWERDDGLNRSSAIQERTQRVALTPRVAHSQRISECNASQTASASRSHFPTIITPQGGGATSRAMPGNSRRIFATHTGRLSRTVAVPLRYAYDWCTDFRSDDGKFSSARPRFRVVKVSPRRVVRVRVASTVARDPPVAVEIVRLSPPDSWHVDQIDEHDLEAVDYKLTALSPMKTRVSLVIVERWMLPKFPKKAEWLRSTTEYWDRLVKAIEERYRNGQPAKG